MKKENRLILELCKFQGPDKAGIEELMTGTVQWPYVLGQLLFHRMGGAAYRVLRNCGLLGRVNRELRNSLKTVCDSGVEKSKSLKTAMGQLAQILGPADFPYALLKGAYLVSLYPEGLRTSNDLDILLNAGDISRLEFLLKGAGFRQGHIRNGDFRAASRTEILSSRMNRGETVPFIKRVDLPGMEYLEIDINFSLDFQARQETGVVAALLKNVQPLIHTEHGALPTLAPADFLIHLCCHLYKEAAVYAWVEMERDLSLYKFADLYLLLEGRTDERLYRQLAEAICRYGLQRECYYALMHTRELFRLDNPALAGLLAAIRPQGTGYLKEIIHPGENKTYGYEESFTDWLFLSGRKERLYEIANASA